MTDDPLDRMIQAWTKFDGDLRIKKGFDEDAYASLKDALRACAEEWAALDSIPRIGANILVDIFAATEADASLYEAELADRIMEAAYELHELVGECVALQ